jgi:activator of HSP90 ATPase
MSYLGVRKPLYLNGIMKIKRKASGPGAVREPGGRNLGIFRVGARPRREEVPVEHLDMVCDLDASPGEVFEAWLSSTGHSDMTGSPAAFGESGMGRFTAWDGYISGEILEAEPGRRILQSWRTTDFKAGEGDSLLEIVLEARGSGTKLRLRHSRLPDGSSEDYRQGWLEYYFEPMAAYFSP